MTFDFAGSDFVGSDFAGSDFAGGDFACRDFIPEWTPILFSMFLDNRSFAFEGSIELKKINLTCYTANNTEKNAKNSPSSPNIKLFKLHAIMA